MIAVSDTTPIISLLSKTLYVTDLDGTLLNKQERIYPEGIRIINHLIEQGMAFTYATARSLSSASIVPPCALPFS